MPNNYNQTDCFGLKVCSCLSFFYKYVSQVFVAIVEFSDLHSAFVHKSGVSKSQTAALQRTPTSTSLLTSITPTPWLENGVGDGIRVLG